MCSHKKLLFTMVDEVHADSLLQGHGQATADGANNVWRAALLTLLLIIHILQAMVSNMDDNRSQ